MPNGLEAPTGPAAFTQFAVHPHAGPDEERDRRGHAGEQNDEAQTLTARFAELVGDEQSGPNADGHFRCSGHGGCGEILGKPIKGVRHDGKAIDQPEPTGNRKRWLPLGFFRPGIAIAPATL